jgi:IS605 OrfB family transposase
MSKMQKYLFGQAKENKKVIVRSVKLKLTKIQEAKLNQWLWNLTGLWNWAIKKIENDAKDNVFYSPFDFVNLVANHSKRVEIPSHVMHGVLSQAYNSWQRCFKKLGKKPHLKGQRNKLVSIPFPDPIKEPVDNKIGIPGLGKVRFHKQDLPVGKIKCGRIVKRASGWYLCLFIDAEHKFNVKETNDAVGIDPGFSTLLTLSDGTKFENPRELRNGALRLAQAQRAKDKHLVARLQERQANRRTDRNHKISRNLVENYKTICYSDDNFKGMTKRFGKSVTEASLGGLIGMLNYKCRTGGRNLIPVNSKFTTMTCSNCGTRSGPTGLDGLAVRFWECATCGAHHDRDENSAQVILNAGLGMSLESSNCRKAV